jgi:hypothetical protein
MCTLVLAQIARIGTREIAKSALVRLLAFVQGTNVRL